MPALVIINMTYLNGKLSTKGSYKPCIHQHLPTPTHTYSHPAKKGHTHPHPPTPSQKYVTLTHTQPRNGHTRPHITEGKNVTCLTHIYVKSIPFSQYFFYWIFWNSIWIYCLFVWFQQLANYISENSKVKVRDVWNIFVFFYNVLLLWYKLTKHIIIIQSCKRGRKKDSTL